MEPSDQKEAVLAVCSSLLHCVKTQNWSNMHNFTLPEGHAAQRNGTDIVLISLADFPASLEKIVDSTWPGKSIEETFDDPEVMVDEDLAVVWAGFRFLVDGEVVVKGRNVFGLHRMEGGAWKISYIADRKVWLS
jgi:hypothetical protein